MSSFINSAKHFNSIYAKLETVFTAGFNANGGFYAPYSLRNIVPNWGIGDPRECQPTQKIKSELRSIVTTFAELQALCVTLQYKHHYAGTLDSQIATETALVTAKTDVAHLTFPGLLAAINCSLYQIEVNHLIELRPLTDAENQALEFFKLMRYEIAMHIAMKTPEYVKAERDI